MHTSSFSHIILFFFSFVLGFGAYICWIVITALRGWKREVQLRKAEKQIQRVLGEEWTLDEIMAREG